MASAPVPAANRALEQFRDQQNGPAVRGCQSPTLRQRTLPPERLAQLTTAARLESGMFRGCTQLFDLVLERQLASLQGRNFKVVN